MSTVAESRGKRTIAPNAKQNALAKLADLKRNGGKRTEQYEVRATRPRIPFSSPLDLTIYSLARAGRG